MADAAPSAAPKPKKGAFTEQALFVCPPGVSLPPLVDIGANLTDEAFEQDADAVLARARAAGVQDVLITGTSVTKSAAAVALAERLGPGVWATAGIHPHDAKEWNDSTAATLELLASHPRCVAIGCVRSEALLRRLTLGAGSAAWTSIAT